MDPAEILLLINKAKADHNSQKAIEFLDSLSDKRERVCFAYTSKYFTAGHVSDQRGEGSNSVVKAKGMKDFLEKATFREAFDRIFSVCRKVQLQCRDDLVMLR